jgi:hypothetical protein
LDHTILYKIALLFLKSEHFKVPVHLLSHQKTVFLFTPV